MTVLDGAMLLCWVLCRAGCVALAAAAACGSVGERRDCAWRVVSND